MGRTFSAPPIRYSATLRVPCVTNPTISAITFNSTTRPQDNAGLPPTTANAARPPKNRHRSSVRAARPNSNCLGNKKKLARPGQPRLKNLLRVKECSGSSHSQPRAFDTITSFPSPFRFGTHSSSALDSDTIILKSPDLGRIAASSEKEDNGNALAALVCNFSTRFGCCLRILLVRTGSGNVDRSENRTNVGPKRQRLRCHAAASFGLLPEPQSCRLQGIGDYPKSVNCPVSMTRPSLSGPP